MQPRENQKPGKIKRKKIRKMRVEKAPTSSWQEAGTMSKPPKRHDTHQDYWWDWYGNRRA